MTPALTALHATEHVLMDFDGPVCPVFDGVDNAVVADTLRAGLTEQGYALPEDLRDIGDPFDMLAHATNLGPAITTAVEHEFALWEQHAVRNSPATPGIRDVLSWINDTGRSVTIVINNAVSAIDTYLEHAGLRPLVGGISARQPDNADRLKPHPHLLTRAIDNLAARPEQCVMIGDSTTDIEAATTARVPAIGCANKPGKADKLTPYASRAIITNMTELLPATQRSRRH